MPRFDFNQVIKDSSQGILWPVYWIYGPEQMLVREVTDCLIRAWRILNNSPSQIPVSFPSSFDGSEGATYEIVEHLQSPFLGGGTVFLVVKDAHLLKELEVLETILIENPAKNDLEYICVFVSRDLDGRKKFSKSLLEKAAVIACEDIPESEREQWIQDFAKRKALTLNTDDFLELSTLEPWSLDRIDLKLEQLSSLRLFSTFSSTPSDTLRVKGTGNAESLGKDFFLDAFFCRNKARSLQSCENFSRESDEALPMLGLLSWYVKQLILYSTSSKISPFLGEKLRKWQPLWSTAQLLQLQSLLVEMDFKMKQTSATATAIWDELVFETL